MKKDSGISPTDPWQPLRRYTNARVGLGRTGNSLPTDALLAFQADHAQARDAVHAPLDVAALDDDITAQGFEVLRLHSAAPDRATYLKRPDLGRTLATESRRQLEDYALQRATPYDAVFIVADGLSALAVQRHAAALLQQVAGKLHDAGWRLGPVVLVEQGRVAVGDIIGQILRAEQAAMLIGERPGLSAADSLGVYLTYAPRLGRTDAERNCISNIHGQGLSYAAAGDTLRFLMGEARRRKLTGVELKDDRAVLDVTASLPDAQQA